MWMPRSCSQVCMVAASTPYTALRFAHAAAVGG
jgi:hypothetical protein